MKLKFERFDTKTYVAVFFLLFGLIFARYCYFGFEYYLQLDDYIQYHNYAAYNADLGALIKKLGLLSSRPLAGLCDLYVWSRFYDRMIAALAAISAMYAASAILLHRVFSRRFGTGWLFFAVYALLPLGFEGTYWISASSRIVVGMFFASAALLCFDEWCENGKRRRLIAFILLQLVAFCFYEQVVLFSCAATLVIMLYNIWQRNRRALWGFWMFVNAATYFIVIKLAPSGVYGSRTALFLPWQEGYWRHLFLPLSWQLKESYFSAGIATCGKGLLRGFKLLISQPNAFYILTILALCSLLFLLARGVKRSRASVLPELFTGVFLAAVPVFLFYILKDAWFGTRNTVTSFCGLAMMGDALLDIIFGRFKKGAAIQAAIVCALALLCCVASVSELYDYRETYLADTAVAEAASEALRNEEYANDSEIWLLNVDGSYLADANFYFHEHGYGVTSSDWALTGAVRAVSGRGDIPMLKPVSTYRHFVIDESKVSAVTAYCYLFDKFVPVAIEESQSGRWTVTDPDGRQVGLLRYKDGGVFLDIYS